MCMRSVWLLLLLLLAMHCIRAEEPASVPIPKSEDEKIAALLAAISSSKLTFIRNGDDHTGAEAAAHLRDKRGKAKDQVKTAKQFIELCATKSEFSDKLYEVKLEDGKTVPLAGWLTGLLETIEQPLKAADAAAGAAELLKKLGDEDFEAREKATEALIRLGAPALEQIAKFEKESDDPEVKQRCAKIRAGIGDPNRTAAHALEAIEKSNATFMRPGGRMLGSTFDGRGFAAHLRAKAMLQKFELTRSAKDFVDEVATKSSLHNTAYRVLLEDGKEKDLREWLVETLKIPLEPEKNP